MLNWIADEHSVLS